MLLSIQLTKEVENEETAQQLYDIVVAKLADHPEVSISGGVSSTLPLEPS